MHVEFHLAPTVEFVIQVAGDFRQHVDQMGDRAARHADVNHEQHGIP